MQNLLKSFAFNSQHTKREIATMLQYALEIRIEFLKKNIKEKYHSVVYKMPAEDECLQAIAYKITRLVDAADTLNTNLEETIGIIKAYLEEYEDDKRYVTEGSDSPPV